jgi:DNA repair protein RadC
MNKIVLIALLATLTACSSDDVPDGVTVLSSPGAVREYFEMQYCDHEHEVFNVVYLDSQHMVLANEEVFRGTIDGSAIYPREIVKACIRHNAAAVIFHHPHPSGVCEPSSADRRITERLASALALLDIRVLDHFITAKGQSYSFAESGLI